MQLRDLSKRSACRTRPVGNISSSSERRQIVLLTNVGTLSQYQSAATLFGLVKVTVFSRLT